MWSMYALVQYSVRNCIFANHILPAGYGRMNDYNKWWPGMPIESKVFEITPRKGGYFHVYIVKYDKTSIYMKNKWLCINFKNNSRFSAEQWNRNTIRKGNKEHFNEEPARKGDELCCWQVDQHSWTFKIVKGFTYVKSLILFFKSLLKFIFYIKKQTICYPQNIILTNIFCNSVYLRFHGLAQRKLQKTSCRTHLSF